MSARRIRRLAPLDLAALPALGLLIALLVVGASNSDRFLTGFNISNVLVQTTPLLLVALGQVIVVASGGLDLSVGSVVSLVTVVVASLATGLGLAPALVIGILAALVVGVVNGMAVAWGLDGFLVTLATFSIAQGLALLILSTPGGGVPDGFRDLASFFGGATGVIPVALPFVLVLAIGAGVLMWRTPHGGRVLAVGSDRGIARLCGVRVSRTLVLAYAASALMAGLAGVFLTSRTLGGDPTGGASLTLDSLAVVVLGGTALGGGRATVFGTVVAAFAVGFLSNVMNLLDFEDYWQTPAKGAIVIAAVLIPAVGARMIEATRRRRAAHATPAGPGLHQGSGREAAPSSS